MNYFVETKGKQDGMNQAFYAVRECEDDICFASDRGRIWCYQKQGGEFRLLELPTKARITSIHTVSNGNTVVTTDFGRVLSLQPEDKQTYALFSRDL